MRRLTLTVALALGTALAARAETEIPLTAKNCKIVFVGTKPGGKHEGGFKKLEGTATVGSDPTACKFKVKIECGSMYTDDEKLTGHLKTEDFFDVRTHETAEFETTKIEQTEKGLKVTGKLTMHGETKEISFPAKIAVKGEAVKLASKFEINRREFGVGTKFPDQKISDKVTLTVTVDAKKE